MPDEERQEPEEELGPEGDDGLGDVEIIDETSPEQLARERAKAPVEDESDSDEDKPDQPEAQAPEDETPPQSEEQPESPPEAQQPQPRTYTQEEFQKAQAAWTRQIQEREEQLQKFNMDAAVEAQIRNLEKQWAPQLGEDEARAQARDPRVKQELEKRYVANQELQQLKARVAHQDFREATQEAVMGMAGWLKQLKAEHHLTDTDLREMAEYIPDATYEDERTYTQMGVRLKKMAMQREKLRKSQRVPPETERTRLESGHPSGNGRETAAQRIERLNFTPIEEWSEADEQFMRTGR